jgi:hypothetical protein
MSKWTALVDDYLALAGQNPRSAHVASTVASDTALQRTLEQAAKKGQQNKVFAQVAGTYEMPTVDRAAMAYGERGMPGRRSVEQVARDSVAEELGPFFREAPMEQVNDAQSLLGPTMGGDDLVKRLEGMTPRPEFTWNLPGNNSPAFQLTDLTFGQRAAMNPPRAMDPDVMAGFRANFEQQGDALASDMQSLAGDISAGRQVAGAPTPQAGDAFTQRLADGRSGPSPSTPSAIDDLSGVDAARLADDIEVPPRSPRGAPESKPRISENARTAAKAAAVGGLGAAAYYSMQGLGPTNTQKPAGASTADLAAETSPPPSVMTQEPAPISPRDQAHALQKQLNAMRAKAGGEVPEAAAMRKEIQRLFDMSDSQTNTAARKGVAPQGADPLSGARRILADLNAGRIPPAQRAQAQAEMQRLYRQADEQANAKTTARRAG